MPRLTLAEQEREDDAARKAFNDAFRQEARFFGLGEVKTEGEAIPYDRYGPPPGPYIPPTRLQRLQSALRKLGRRLRELPERLWWASFGGDSRDDYDGGW